MIRTDTISKPKADEGQARMLAFFASCAFHALVLGLLLWITFLYGTHTRRLGSTSPGVPTITLSTLVITPPAVVVPVVVVPAVIPVLKPVKPVVPVKVAPAPRPTPPHPAVVAVETRPVQSGMTIVPGTDQFPQPPYPEEAREHRQTGTVLMSVVFDSNGGVAAVKVAKSSGYLVLDASTRSFIRAEWHDPAYAGQTVDVPVQYTLENP